MAAQSAVYLKPTDLIKRQFGLSFCPRSAANQELKFLAQSLSRLKPTEKFLKIAFNPFQWALALSQEL